MNPNEMSIGDLVDYAPPLCFEEDFPFVWQMTRAERFCFLHLIKQFKPELALEIGTSKGGSLQVLSRYAAEVISIDIDPAVEAALTGAFPNVAFRSGDSTELLPLVVKEINQSGKSLGFVLIDGDHSESGVRRDINAVLQLKPKRPIAVVLHDSFHPPCREGMLTAAWADCPYVHYVELDFVGGIFVPGRATVDGSMVSGLGFALLLPEKRAGELKILQSQSHKFQIVRRFAGRSNFLKRDFVSLLLNPLRRAKTKLQGLFG